MADTSEQDGIPAVRLADEAILTNAGRVSAGKECTRDLLLCG